MMGAVVVLRIVGVVVVVETTIIYAMYKTYDKTDKRESREIIINNTPTNGVKNLTRMTRGYTLF